MGSRNTSQGVFLLTIYSIFAPCFAFMILGNRAIGLVFRIFGVVFLFLGLSVSSNAQKVLDDSTKLIYGPRTTKIFLESDIYHGKKSEQTIDTSLTNFHNYNYVYNQGNIFQNQGIIGSAAQPVFRNIISNEIGYRLGINPYGQFQPNQNSFRYYNTRSPYTSVYLVESGIGESVVKVDFAVNADSLINIGASYQKLISEKLIDQQRQRDRQVDSDLFTFFTSLRSRNNKYHFLGNIYIFSHNAIENGGFGVNAADTINWFQRQSIAAKFRTNLGSSAEYLPKSFEKRTNAHFYQEYDLTKNKWVVLFHKFNFTDQYIGYRETNVTSLAGGKIIPTGFYLNSYLDSVRTDQTLRYFSVENTFGLKSQSNRHFLSAYITDRRFNYHQMVQTITQDSVRVSMRSTSVGGEFSLRLADSLLVNFQAEIQPTFAASGNQLSENFKNNFDNRFSASARWRFVEFYFNHLKISPSIFQTALISNHFKWQNKFSPTTTDEIGARVGYKLPWHTASLEGQIQNITDYIYFKDSVSTPLQYSKGSNKNDNVFQVYYLTASIGFNFWKFGFTTLLRYSRTSFADEKDSPIRFPQIYANPQLYFQTYLIKKVLKFQVGFDAQYRLGYYADKYSPAIQTFYVQNSQMLNTNTMLNFFLTTQIKRIRIYIRLNNILQPTTDWGRQESKVSNVYTNTPGYFGVPFSFVFGFNWTFYD